MRVSIENESVVVAVNEMVEKVFSTGSRGFYGGFKFVNDGKRYQVSMNVVEIGSKPKK